MKTKADLVVIGLPWMAMSPETRQIFTQLAQQRRILWVTLPGLCDPQVTLPPLPHNLHLQALRALPSLLTPWATHLQTPWLARQIRQRMQRLQMQRPMLIVNQVEGMALAGALKLSRLVYLRTIQPSALGMDAASAHQAEQALVATADLVLTETGELADDMPAVKTCPLQVCAEPLVLPRPRDLPQGRPIIGFHGPLDDRIDWSLVHESALRRPDWYWVLIGPRQTDALDKLLQLRNVFWLGEKNHAQLQACIHHWQVTLLPYLDTADVRAQAPLALQQALHRDAPLVVTSKFAGLPAFRPLLTVLHSMQELSELLPIIALPPSATVKLGSLGHPATRQYNGRDSQSVAALLDTFD